MRPFPYFLQHCSPLLYSHLAQHCLRWKYLRHLATLWIQTVGRVFHSRRMIVHENLWNDRTKQKSMSSQIRRWMSKWPTLLCHQGAFRFWVSGSSRWPGYLLFLLKHRITIHHIEYVGHLKFHSTTHWPWKPSTSVHPADVFKHLHKYVTWKLLCHSSLIQVKGTVFMSYLSFLALARMTVGAKKCKEYVVAWLKSLKSSRILLWVKDTSSQQVFNAILKPSNYLK